MSTKLVTAEEEYAKHPDLKKEDIAELQRWAATQPHLPDITEEKMILFYHSCYWHMENTKTCILMNYATRDSTPEFFKNRDVSRPELQKAIKAVRYSPIPVKDPNGYQIIAHGLRQFEASKYVFADSVKLLAMSMEACAYVEGTVPGYVFLFDMNGVRLSHLTRLSYGLLKKFFVYIQEGLPVRLKAIHVVNALPLVDKILFMIKPFVKKEILSLVHFHYGGFEEVHNIFQKDCLPRDFDGDLKSMEELHNDYIEWMEKMTPIFLADEVYKREDAETPRSLNLDNLCID